MLPKSLPIFQVDAFTEDLFGGNPAAVCPLKHWLPDETMQKIASENNLSETAFLVPMDGGFQIRWFTPKLEVDLCGHATLASAYVIFNELNYPSNSIDFQSKSGLLQVSQEQQQIILDFPSDPPEPCTPPTGLLDALGVDAVEVLKGMTDYLVILPEETDIRTAAPNFTRLSLVEARGIIISAPGDRSDFVSRFFAPASGIDEDPVTGSAHCTLTPYWSHRLNKSTLQAQQLSQRKGVLQCTMKNDRVLLTGQAVLYMKGSIEV